MKSFQEKSLIEKTDNKEPLFKTLKYKDHREKFSRKKPDRKDR